MYHMNLTSCPADPDDRMRLAEKSYGCQCYEYVLLVLYVDDTLVVSENAEAILRGELGQYFELQEVSLSFTMVAM